MSGVADSSSTLTEAATSEADTVRLVFRRYAELGSVRLLKAELEARGIKSNTNCRKFPDTSVASM